MPEKDERAKENHNNAGEPKKIPIGRVENGPERRSVVLYWEDENLELPSGTPLRITVNDLTFYRVKLNRVKLNAFKDASHYSPDPVVLLPPNNTCSCKVNGTSKPDQKDDLKKIIQPSYALGMNIITNDEYNNLQNQYLAQSELSLGLIIPLILIVLGLALIPQIGLGPAATGGLLHSLTWFFMCASLAFLSTLLFIVGAERFQKWRMEVKLLILGNWQKQQEAKKKAASDANGAASSSKAIQKAVAKAIKDARFLDGRLNVRVDAKS